jgi:hypothetical protein
MGLDFIRKAAPSFHRALDRRAVDLRTPSLFVRDIPVVARSASAEICHGSRFKLGERLLLRVIANKLVAQRDNLVVAEFPSPPAEFLNQVQSGAGVGQGEVRAIHKLSDRVEIGFANN